MAQSADIIVPATAAESSRHLPRPITPDSGKAREDHTVPQSNTAVHAQSSQIGGLRNRSFLGLLVTQFLGATNDNIFRWLVVPIGKDLAGPGNEGIALSAGLALLVLPYLLFAAPAGYLADRFSKRNVMLGCKLAEIVLMLLGVGTIWLGNIYLMFAVVFLMGIHSALFSPSKYGAIPEVVRPEQIASANGLIGMSTILAIVLGTVVGGYLYYWTCPLGQSNLHISAATLLGVAVTGTLACTFIRRTPIADPTRQFPLNFAGQSYRDMRTLFANRALLWAALGTALFWSLGGLCQLNVDRFAIGVLGVAQQYVGPLLAMLALGVGLGNVAAGYFSRGRIELGIVPLGAAGIAFGAMLLALAPGVDTAATVFASPGYLWSGICLLLLGLGAGLYDVPLEAFLQQRSPEEQRGAILSASNFLTFSGTILASLVFAGMTKLELSGRTIFFLSGLCVVPVILCTIWLIPVASVRFFVWILTKVFYRVRLQGLENLPREGGALLVANHVSWIDGVILLTYSPRPIRMIAYSDYIQAPGLGWLARKAGTIPIRPGRPRSVVEALRTARESIRNGELVCIFPEGGLTRTGQMQPFHPGFMAILKDCQEPLIPIRLLGFWGSIFSHYGGKLLWKLPRKLPYPLTIRIGEPMYQVSSVEQVRQAVEQLGNADHAAVEG